MCADCGCNVVRGHVLDTCTDPECCCAGLPIRTIDTLADEVRHAMETVDLAAMAALLAPDARWGAPEQEVPTCRNAQQILSWYEMARDNGVRADITEIVIEGNNIVVGLNVLNAKDPSKPPNNARWQVLSVDGGLVSEIRGYETRDEAMEYAMSGVSHWTT